MAETLISKEVEERRLNDFLEIAEHWDEIPEYARGKLDGTISAIAAMYNKDIAQVEKAG